MSVLRGIFTLRSSVSSVSVLRTSIQKNPHFNNADFQSILFIHILISHISENIINIDTDNKPHQPHKQFVYRLIFYLLIDPASH